MTLRTIVQRTIDHRGQGGRIRYHLHLECGHTVTRASSHSAATTNARVHCPQCDHTTKTGKETRL